MTTLGQRIKEARKAKRLTQKELAKLIGASNTSVSDWENDLHKPDMDTVELLCGALDVTPSFLMNFEEAPRPKDLTPKQELFEYMNKVFDTNDEYQMKLMLSMAQMDKEGWIELEKLINDIMKNKK